MNIVNKALRIVRQENRADIRIRVNILSKHFSQISAVDAASFETSKGTF
ncbi:MAG: hypothetical protein PHE58_06475 [Candidatus Omnitrophica bacterium]|nr:hypothetical protein [Candidatus Omnitrophota bacterium]